MQLSVPYGRVAGRQNETSKKMMRTIQMAIACLAVAVVTADQLQAAIVSKIDVGDIGIDNSSTTRNFTFTIGDFGAGQTTVNDVNLSIFFAKSNDDSYVPRGSAIVAGVPYLNEIEFTLTSPSGTNFTLISNTFGSRSFNNGTAGFKGTILFDQSAALAVNSSRDSITAGTRRPDDATPNSLNIFNGQNAVGTWKLFIEDNAAADILSYYEATLIISAVPEPSSLALISIGVCVVGVGAARRRRLKKD